MGKNSELSARRFAAASFQGGILSAFYENQMPVRVDFSAGESSLVGNIYLGRVSHIVKNLGAVFVDIGEERPAFLADAGSYVLGNAESSSGRRLREGDFLPVKVRKDAHGIKGPTVTSRFPERKDQELMQRVPFLSAPARLLTAEPSWLSMLRECFPLSKSSGNLISSQSSGNQASLPGDAAETADTGEGGTTGKDSCDEIITDSAEIFEILTGKKPPEEVSYRKKLPEKFRTREELPLDIHTGVRVRFWNDPKISLSSLYAMETLLRDCTSRKVWLKGGGFLVIDPTEAMTVIDVNSGKFEKSGSRRETIRRVDLEAAEEIMRQVRLRNLSGIIVADFIDLSEKEDQESLLALLRELAAGDPVQTEIVDLTKLNLVEMTRRKSGRTLAEQIKKFS